MLELRRNVQGWQLGHSGDTFNTALYLARLGETVAYWTALGDDAFSEEMRESWRVERLDTSLVLTAPGRLPGLYTISNDTTGERRFRYWRKEAAVRLLFNLPDSSRALAAASTAQLLYLSGITLALFEDDGRAALAGCARAVRAAGGQVAFDPNYRPALWDSPAAAQNAMMQFAPFVSIALPTFEDEYYLHGDNDPMRTASRWRAWGAGEIVVKLGSRGCMLMEGEIVPPRDKIIPVDTTAAGDSFNAGYIAGRHRGMTVRESAEFANGLAARVIGYPGAIIPASALTDLVAVLDAGRRSLDHD